MKLTGTLYSCCQAYIPVRIWSPPFLCLYLSCFQGRRTCAPGPTPLPFLGLLSFSFISSHIFNSLFLPSALNMLRVSRLWGRTRKHSQ